MRRIEPPEIKDRSYICPICGEAMRYVKSCSVFVCDNMTCNVYFLAQKTPHFYGTEFIPIVEESLLHYADAWMQKEMEVYGFTEEFLRKYSVGYLPNMYWMWRSDDSPFGTLTFPLVDWHGNVVNLLGKHIGRDEKLDLTKAIHKADNRHSGIFNADAFWNEEGHIYTNPTDCLRALQGGQENSVSVFDGAKFPEVFPAQKIILHTPPTISVDRITEAIRKIDSSIEVVSA